MDSNIQEILVRFKRRIYFHRQYKEAFSQIETAIENTRTLGEPVCALLYGPSGTGKSTLCRYFENHYSSDPVIRREDGTYLQLPVFYCEVPAPTTVRGLIVDMIVRLIGDTPNGTIGKLTHQLMTCLKTAGVKVIFLDEIQQLCISTVSEKTRLDSLQWIVSFLNRSGIPVILSGTELCRNIRSSHAAFASRYPYLVELSNFTYESDDSSDLIRTLKSLDTAMYDIAALNNGLHLNDPTIAAPLFMGTGGNLKKIRLIINDALRFCLERDDQKQLQLEDFFMAFDGVNWPKIISKENPFGLDYMNVLHQIADYQET